MGIYYIYILLSVLIVEVQSEDCPQLDGEEEFKQFLRFNEYRIDAVGEHLSPEEIASRVAIDSLENPRWLQLTPDLNHRIEKELVTSDSGRYRLRIILEEMGNGQITWGGSSFRTELQGLNSKVMCPYRDFFNGTYLICCEVVENISQLRLTHEHFNFSAYEAYYEPGRNRSRKVSQAPKFRTISDI